MDPDRSERDALRTKLKEKMRDKKMQRRGGERSVAIQSKASSVQDALLSAAGNDADSLRLAHEAMKDPTRLLDFFRGLSGNNLSLGTEEMKSEAEKERTKRRGEEHKEEEIRGETKEEEKRRGVKRDEEEEEEEEDLPESLKMKRDF